MALVELVLNPFILNNREGSKCGHKNTDHADHVLTFRKQKKNDMSNFFLFPRFSNFSFNFKNSVDHNWIFTLLSSPNLLLLFLLTGPLQ